MMMLLEVFFDIPHCGDRRCSLYFIISPRTMSIAV